SIARRQGRLEADRIRLCTSRRTRGGRPGSARCRHLDRLLPAGGVVTFTGIDDVVRRFDAEDYLLDIGTASAIYLAVSLSRPLLLEGEPGVGKTTAAKTLAAVLDAPLVRLQCYEGLSANEALYDWNYQRQLLSIRLAE